MHSGMNGRHFDKMSVCPSVIQNDFDDIIIADHTAYTID